MESIAQVRQTPRSSTARQASAVHRRRHCEDSRTRFLLGEFYRGPVSSPGSWHRLKKSQLHFARWGTSPASAQPGLCILINNPATAVPECKRALFFIQDRMQTSDTRGFCLRHSTSRHREPARVQCPPLPPNTQTLTSALPRGFRNPPVLV